MSRHLGILTFVSMLIIMPSRPFAADVVWDGKSVFATREANESTSAPAARSCDPHREEFRSPTSAVEPGVEIRVLDNPTQLIQSGRSYISPVRFARTEPAHPTGIAVDPSYRWWSLWNLSRGLLLLEPATALIAPEPGIYRFSGEVEFSIDRPVYNPLHEEPFGVSLIARAQSEDAWSHRDGDRSRGTFPGTDALSVQGTIRMETGDRIFLLLSHDRHATGGDAADLHIRTVASSARFELQRIAD